MTTKISVADQYLWLTVSDSDPATDPAIFVNDLEDRKNYFCCQAFSLISK
jgi:hypothetical protein